MDDYIRQKYIILKKEVYEIKNKLISLETNYDELMIEMRNTILIDNKLLEEDIVDKVCDGNKNVYNELVNEVIPRINNKI